MKKTDRDYIILRSIISVHTKFYEQFESIFHGYDDEGDTKDIIEAVNGTFETVKEIEDQSYKLLSEDLTEGMKEMLEELKEVINIEKQIF